jgi:hypothetical protein
MWRKLGNSMIAPLTVETSNFTREFTPSFGSPMIGQQIRDSSVEVYTLRALRQKSLEIKNCETVLRLDPDPVIGHDQ